MVGRLLTMPLCNLDNEFLRTFLCQNQGREEEGVFYTSIKTHSVALMGTLW